MSLGSELDELARTIAERRSADADISYTAKLLQAGEAHCARKIGEEGLEVALALALRDREGVCAEAADLLYHVLVGLQALGVSPEQVAEILRSRRGKSGLQEKALRATDGKGFSK